jgi:hypothetical protein
VANASGGRLKVTASVNIPGVWMLSSQTITATGHTSVPATQACSPSGPFQACNAYLGTLHLRQLVTYQPAATGPSSGMRWRSSSPSPGPASGGSATAASPDTPRPQPTMAARLVQRMNADSQLADRPAGARSWRSDGRGCHGQCPPRLNRTNREPR